MLLTLAGNNSFALKRRLDELAAEFIKGHGDLALERFDGEEAKAGAILDAVQAIPFLSSRKMLVVRNGSANKDLQEQIEQIISSISNSTDLIFYEPSIDKRTAYFKVLKKQTEYEEFSEPDAPDLAKWLVEEAKKQSAELALADANYLVQRVGANQQMLSSELDKLITYNSHISRENIELLTEPTPQGKVFDLLDAAFGGQKQRALRLYEEQRLQKVEPNAILAMLAWQLDILALCKLAGDRQPAQIAKDAGLSPFPVMKANSLAKKLTNTELEELVSEALEIDYKNKTKGLDLDEALKTYIATM